MNMKIDYKTLFADLNRTDIKGAQEVREQGEAMVAVADGIATWTMEKAELQMVGRALERGGKWAEKVHWEGVHRQERADMLKLKNADKPKFRHKKSKEELEEELAELLCRLEKLT